MVATVAAAWGPSSCISAVVCDRGTTHCSCSIGSDAIRQGSLSSLQSTLGHTGSVSSSTMKIVGGRECGGFGSSGLMGNRPIWRLWSWKGNVAKSITSSSNTPRAAVATGTDASEHITVPKEGVENLVGQQGGADGGESSSQPKNGVADVKKRRQPGGGDGLETSSQAKSAVAEVEKRGQQGVGDEGESSSGEEEELMEKGFKMSGICDRLIEVFLTERTTPTEWRSLLAMSTEWVRIRPHFYKRCKAKARAETVPKRKRELNKLARQVKEVDDSMMRQEKLLAEIEKNTFEIDIVVAQRRKEFTGEFFEHLQTLCESTSRPNRREEIAAIAGKCLSLIQAHDAALEDSEAITEAQLKFDKILNSSSLEAAANQINQLAQSKELDSTLLLLITRAWVAAKDSTTMKQEVKDIMFYLYSAAKRSMLKLVPDEIHIMKYLLSIPDPRDRFAAMTSAFAPGDELEEKIENKFHTSPEKLKHWIKLLVDAYHSHKQSTLIKEAQKLMNPEAISRLEILLEYMDDTFIIWELWLIKQMHTEVEQLLRQSGFVPIQTGLRDVSQWIESPRYYLGGSDRKLLCNDEGVPLVEAYLDKDLDSTVHASAGFQAVPELQGYDVLGMDMTRRRQDMQPGGLPCIFLQVTRFKCGRVVLAVTFNHMHTDGKGCFYFMKAWSDLARTTETTITAEHSRALAESESFKYFLAKRKANETSVANGIDGRDRPAELGRWAMRVFEVNASTIQSLKQEAKGNKVGPGFVSTGDCILAHPWKALARLSSSVLGGREVAVRMAVDGRSKFFDPPLPNLCGNAVVVLFAPRIPHSALQEMPVASIASKLREQLHTTTKEEWFSLQRMEEAFIMSRGNQFAVVRVTSWFSFPKYDIDFGFRKPYFAQGVNSRLIVRGTGTTVGVYIGSPIPSSSSSVASLSLWGTPEPFEALECDPEFLPRFLPRGKCIER